MTITAGFPCGNSLSTGAGIYLTNWRYGINYTGNDTSLIIWPPGDTGSDL